MWVGSTFLPNSAFIDIALIKSSQVVMFTAWKPSNATNQSSYLLVVSSSTRAGLPAHNYYLRINLLAGIDGPHDNLHMVKHYTNTRFLKSLFPAIYNSEMRAMSVAKVKTFPPIALHFLQTP